MSRTKKALIGLYIGLACLTLIFQIYVRSSQCRGVSACGLSFAKGAVWSVIWPASWVTYEAGRWVSTSESRALLIEEFGPTKIMAGQDFNVQPDGRSAVWMKLNRKLPGGSRIRFGDIDLVAASNGTVVSALVPRTSYATAGKIQIVVVDANGKSLSPPVQIEVVPKNGN